jgi:hypothetical protein
MRGRLSINSFAVAIIAFSLISFFGSVHHTHVASTTEWLGTDTNASISSSSRSMYGSSSLEFTERHRLSVKRKAAAVDADRRSNPVLSSSERILMSAMGPTTTRTIIRDDLCPGCRLSYQDPTKLCGTLLQNVMDQTTTTTNSTITPSQSQAGERVAQAHAGACSRCSPSSCSDSDKNYYRLDDVAPRILHAHTYLLESVAQELRFPVSALTSVAAFLSNPQNVFPAKEYLFEFNPSIVQLPASQVPENMNMNIPGERPVYLASFRVGNDHLCVSQDAERTKMIGGDLDKWDGKKNYLGLALLRSDLTVIQEVVVDALEYMHRFTDPRLHVIHGQIYVSSYQRIHPIWIVPPKDLPANFIENEKIRFPFTVELSNVWPSTSEMTVTMRRHGSCTKDRRTQLAGKNLQYFVDGDNRTMMEVDPMGAKEPVDLDARCQKTPKRDAPASFVESKDPLPYSSFGTLDELHFARKRIQEYPYSGEHGSACCIHAKGPDGRNLLLGVSHTKSRPGHEERFGVGQLQYSSRFYAMESVAPYRVVARTGRFCFGFPEKSSQGLGNRNPYTNMSTEKLYIGQEYDCPKIHFVGSMIEMANDPSKLIVAYGVNDCVPRTVVIELADVLRMLFSPHERFQAAS